MESTRDANIAANNAFMEELGFTSGGLAANNFRSTKVVAPGEKAAAKHRSNEVKVAKGTSKPKVNKQLIRTIRQFYFSVPSSLHVTILWTKAHVTKRPRGSLLKLSS